MARRYRHKHQTTPNERHSAEDNQARIYLSTTCCTLMLQCSTTEWALDVGALKCSNAALNCPDASILGCWVGT
eukprot:scaffold147465_cov20-Tisochrysis_lutea.AAC.2